MSFLRDYLDYATGNEAPEMFHVWGAYVALSASVSRRVWLPFEDTAIFPNVYVMFVGPAGNGKTWAMRKCKRILAELSDVPISGSVETPPGLWRFMMGDPKANPPKDSPVAFPARWPDGIVREVHPMTIIANEFINFISVDDKGWINALNDIYDEDLYRYRTKNMGEDILIGPYIVLLGALTNEVASDLQKARIISTGLARRTLFQYGERRWDDPHPKPSFNETQRSARDRCVQHLRQLQKTGGAFYWSKEIDTWWTNWYCAYLVEVPKQPPAVQSWFASKSIQVLKLAMLTCLSEGFKLRLEVGHFETALEFLAVLEKDLIRIFGGVGRNELAAVALKIGEYIEARDLPVSKRDLKVNFFTMCKPPNEFEDCLQFLVDTRRVVTATMLLGSSYTDTIYATPSVMQSFADDARARGASLVGVNLNESLQGSADAIRPSPLPTSNPWETLSLSQVVAQLPDEILDDQPQMFDLEEC